MLTKEHIDDLLNKNGNIVSADGDKIGSLGQVYADDDNGQPTWVTARTGLFGLRSDASRVCPLVPCGGGLD